MTAAEREILLELDQLLRSEEIRTLIEPVIERVRANLSRQTDAFMTWEPIPLTNYGTVLLTRSNQAGFLFCAPVPTPGRSVTLTVING